MEPKLKYCRRCHKQRMITNKSRGWCRACMAKLNDRYTIVKVLPHPEKYDEILTMAQQGHTQSAIVKRVGMSRTSVQNIIARFTQKIDAEGNVRPQ